MSDPWSGPQQPEPVDRPPLRQELLAAAVTVSVCLLVAAPVGLLWAQLAPRVQVQVVGNQFQLVDPYGDGYIASDAYFLAAVVLAGVVGGLLAWWLGRRHGPTVVVALALGGLAAAFTAMTVGAMVDRSEVRNEALAVARSGGQAVLPLSVELRSLQALAGWPAGALLAYLGASLVIGESRTGAQGQRRELSSD